MLRVIFVSLRAFNLSCRLSQLLTGLTSLGDALKLLPVSPVTSHWRKIASGPVADIRSRKNLRAEINTD